MSKEHVQSLIRKRRDSGATLRVGEGEGGTVSDLILGGGGAKDSFSY